MIARVAGLPDLYAGVLARGLAARGVAAERHAGFDHDADGVWRAPDVSQVAWFRDPDGNLLSLVRYG